MNDTKIAMATVAVMLVSGCALIQPPYTTKPHTTYQDSTTFQSTAYHLTQDLHQVLRPLNLREEKGQVRIALQGGDLDSLTEQKLRQELSEFLQLPVQLTYQPSSQSDISGELDVTLMPDTCRYNRRALPVSAYACQQLRNQYFSVVNKSTWSQGETYQSGSSALDTGAVQRLFSSQLKSAERQPVTGE